MYGVTYVQRQQHYLYSSKYFSLFTLCSVFGRVLCLRLCAATITSTAALMTRSATWRHRPATASQGAVLPSAGLRRCLRSLQRNRASSATGRYHVLKAPPAARQHQDSGHAALYFRSVLGRRWLSSGLVLIHLLRMI